MKVELDRVDVYLQISMMSSHLELLRVGHLNQVHHVFDYLTKCNNIELVYLILVIL